MAYLTVTTPFDVVAPGDGQLSLREAIEQANGVRYDPLLGISRGQDAGVDRWRTLDQRRPDHRR